MSVLKCLKCKKIVKKEEVDEEFHFIFDESGVELELQKLLKECFDINVTKKRADKQGVCSPCVENLVDTYDLLQKDVEDNFEAGLEEIDEQEEVADLKTEDSDEINVDNDEYSVPSKFEVQEEETETSPIEEFQEQEEENDPNVIEVDVEVDGEQLDEGHIEEFEYVVEEEAQEQPEVEEIAIEQVYDKRKEMEEYFIDNLDEEYMDGDDPNDEEDDKKVSLLETMNEDNIDIFEYKKTIIKIDPTETNLKHSLFCVYCKKNLIFHKTILDHIKKIHISKKGKYMCIAQDDCEEFDNIRDLSYHLVLKHYDLASLQIAVNCPECLESYDNFVEFNAHYCCPKGVINRSARVCKPCCTEFLSHKRFRVHQQFHLPKYRPKICFLCDKVFKMEEDFYEHIMYGHKSDNELSLMCRHCDTVWTNPSQLEKHAKVHLKEPVERCYICANSYTSAKRLALHIKFVHDQRDDNDCKICGEQFHFKGKLKVHVETHNDVKEGKLFICGTCGLCEPDLAAFDSHNHNRVREEVIEYSQEELSLVYACEFCEKAFKTPLLLKQHRLKAKHETYNCDMCVEVFGRFQALKTHRLRHDYGDDSISKFPVGRNYVCDFGKCEVSFLHWHLLKKHTSTHVWMNASKKCKLCGVVLENYTKLMYHLEKVHCEVDMEEKAMQSCPSCMKMFKTKVGLSIHLTAKHSSNEFPCPTCKQAFKTSDMLDRHVKNNHSSVTCPICEKVLRHSKNLNLHINTIHKKIIRYRCTQCDKGFYLNCDLKEHEKANHTSDKPLKCDFCPYSCYYPSRLQLHILQEHEGKAAPFKCDICGKGFYQKGTLRSHKIRHGEKEYKCLVESCDREFFTRTALIRHGAKMHAEVDFSHAPKLYKRRVRRDGYNPAAKRKRITNTESVSDVFVDDDDGLSEEEFEEDDVYYKVEEEVVEDGENDYVEEEYENEEDEQEQETKEEIIEVYQGEDMDDAYIIQMEEDGEEIIEELEEDDEEYDYI